MASRKIPILLIQDVPCWGRQGLVESGVRVSGRQKIAIRMVIALKGATCRVKKEMVLHEGPAWRSTCVSEMDIALVSSNSDNV